MFDLEFTTHRRGFLGGLAAGAAALGLGSLIPSELVARPRPVGPPLDDPQLDAWLNKITGAHRQVYDMPEVDNGMGFVFSRVFYMTNEETGVPESDLGVVVVLRHLGATLAMTDAMWAKYKLGEMANVTDPKTKAPAVRNLFYKVPPGELPLPGASIDALMASGALFGACHMALKAGSQELAKKMNMPAEDIEKDMLAHLIPGVQLVPSGVWAVNRVQERGCTYCFAG
ncbi:MAG: twin-arginine translocation signal domain-containing protein [Gemmatimonadetes bacterium]|nr:twin-arginine translocation signal domain-containing protein [Gemmatimonadota bacterium]